MEKISILLIGALLAFSANATTIEPDAIIPNHTPKAAIAAATIVKMHGYTCDSISSYRYSSWSDEYVLVCNQYQYVFNIKDVGGKIRVTVDE